MEDNKENAMLLRDNEDYEYIYGVLILKGNIFDIELLQKRIDETREELGYDDYNGEDIVKEVLKRYEEYKDIIRYIPYNNYDLEV